MDNKDIQAAGCNHLSDQEKQTQEIISTPHDPESSARSIQASVEPIYDGNTAHGDTAPRAPRRSGGPRTERGKKRSSRNAIRHGIFSGVVLPRESPREYQRVFNDFCSYLKPNDGVERMLVEKLAANLWRTRRLILAESIEVVNTSERAKMETAVAGFRDRQKRENMGRLIASDAHSPSLERAIELLRQLRARIQERGFDIDEDTLILFQLFGPLEGDHLPMDSQIVYGYWLRYSYIKTKNMGAKDGTALEDAKKHAIEMIDQQIEVAESRRAVLELFEIVRKIGLFPSEVSREAIMRYESHLGRDSDRTLQQIERLRRIRSGQPTGAPIEVKLTT